MPLHWIALRQTTAFIITLAREKSTGVVQDLAGKWKLVKMASYENLSDSELRKKLLEIGLDLPVSINRDFLIKKLKSVYEGGSSARNGNRRKSVGRSTAVEKETSASLSSGTTGQSTGGSSSSSSSGAVHSRTKSRLSLSEISTTGSPKRRNHNLELSVDTSSPSTRSSTHKSRLSSYASPFHSTIIGGNEDDLNNSNITPRETRKGNATTAADLSWSKKSDPKEWSRYSSLFPSSAGETTTSPPPAANTSGGVVFPSNSFVASTSPSASLSSSLHVTNGSWNHSPAPALTTATPASRLSRRSFANNIHTPVTSASERLSGVTHHTSDRGHFISSILVGFAILFFAIIAILYLNLSSNNAGKVPGLSESAIQSPADIAAGKNINKAAIDPSVLTSNYPLCSSAFEDEDSSSCIPSSQLKTARALFSTLKDELVQRAKWKPCTDVQDRVPLNVAKTLLYHLSDKKKTEVDDCFNSMLILSVENPNWGLKIDKEGSDEVLNRFDLKSIDFSAATISAVNIVPTFYCTALGYARAVFTYFLYMSIVAAVAFMVYKGVTYYQKKRRDEANEVFLYVENILQMLQEQYEHAKEHGGDPFLAVSHIRDALVPAQDRISKSALWNKVVDHISNNESRVREEIQHISGEEFRVWRWLPSVSPAVSRKSFLTPPTSPSITPPSTPPPYSTTNSARSPMGTPQIPFTCSAGSKWQGQAFEVSESGVNALPITPTNCLKIRQMFDSEAVADEDREAKIQNAILEKCVDSNICHIGVEHGSAEGCVYVKCASKEDARKAYMALHGWWFDGHLLSVKFLREERYLVRFPWAKNCTTPLRRH